MTRSCLFFALLAGLSSAWAAEPEVASPSGRSYGSLQFEPCALKAPGTSIAVDAQCTTFAVAENRDDADSRSISLALAWVPASKEAEPDPIFLIAGGPGQAAKQAYPMVNAAFRDVRRSRDVMLLDARGTGDSHPLVCRDAEGEAAISEGESMEPTLAADFARRCAEQLAADSDLRYYGTAQHVEDLDAARQALGAEKINLIGVSYGTRVAQQYAKRYPQHVRSVVLDSVVPNDLALGSEHAANLENALNLQFERCRQQAGCAERIGDPRALLEQVRTALSQADLPPVSYRDALSGEWKSARPQFEQLGILLRMYAYSPETAALLPYLLSEAAQGRYAAMLAQADSLQHSLTEQIYHGMQLSVMCAEDMDGLQAREEDANTVLGGDFVRFAQAQCAVWPRGTPPANFREPLTGPTPVLLLSGEFDPVTPPRYADAVAAQLDNARHLILPGQGHSVVGLGCMPKLFAQFVETADPSKLDASCLQRMKPLPPFAGVYGWEP